MPKAPTTKHRRARLQDIAESAGVSISCVSLVLGNKARERRISEEVVKRVRKAATDLDYSPNIVAQNLQHGRSHTISFFNGFRQANPGDIYMDKLSGGIQVACGKLGYDLLVTCDFSRSAEDTYRYLNGGRCDGLVLFAAGEHEPLLPYLQASKLPTVLLNGIDPTERMASVSEDDASGMSQIADLLVSLGHRRIAAFSHTGYANLDSVRRVRLLREYLSAYSIHIPERWILDSNDPEDMHPERDLDTILAEPEPPTAIFCWHDLLGYRVLEHCARRGIDVPGQISVIGYDGIRWPSASPHELASIRVDVAAIAQEAVNVLNERINDPESEFVHRLVPVSLSMGTTLAPPRA